jgi:hypothetical protein
MSNATKVAIPLREDEMVVIVIRAFFEVPADHDMVTVIEGTDPDFLGMAKDAVRGIMDYWREKITAAGMTGTQLSGAMASAGLDTEGKVQ